MPDETARTGRVSVLNFGRVACLPPWHKGAQISLAVFHILSWWHVKRVAFPFSAAMGSSQVEN